jgi:glycosyltransferase involved in cell wall biosynthesis
MCVPTEVGGTHPVIVEAMAAGACLLVSDHAPNLEVVGEAAATFALEGGAATLADQLMWLIDSAEVRAGFGRLAAQRGAERFSWSRCASRYLALCEALQRG